MLFVIPKSVADSVYDTMQFHAAVKVTCELLLKTDFITIVSQKDSRQDGQISCITLVPAELCQQCKSQQTETAVCTNLHQLFCTSGVEE